MHCGFRCLDGEVVHHFDGRWKHACGDDVANGGAGLIRTGKCSEKSAHALRPLHDAQNDFCGDAQRAFRTDKNAHKIVPRRIESFPSQMHQRTIGEHHFQSQDMRGGKSVLQTMRAPGIFRDVATDAAHGLRGRVRRVEILLGLHAASDIEIDHSGLDHHARVR